MNSQIDLIARAPEEIVPHPFQFEAIDDITTAAANGARRILLQAATGAGKTIVASKIIHHATSNGLNVLFLAHRRELVYQCSKKLESFGVAHGVLIAGDPWDPTRLVNVASIQTLHSRTVRSKRISFPKADLVIIDECFPAGTLVDGRPIESLGVGDSVLSLNEATGAIESKKIVHRFKRKPRCLVRVWLASGKFIVCTPNHPIFASGEWAPAWGLMKGDMVYGVSNMRRGVLSIFSKVRELLSRRYARAEPADGAREDAGAESNAHARNPREGHSHAQEDQALSQSQRGERVSDLLQIGHCQSKPKNRDRGGWFQSFFSGSESARPEEVLVSGVDLVDRVEVLEFGSDGRFGGLCPDGHVYNFEVEDNNTYFANGILVHNCHHLNSSKTWQDVIDAYPEAFILGLTATPINRRGRGLGHFFDEMVCCPSILWLIKNGYLVPPRYFVPSLVDLKGLRVVAGDYVESDLEERMDVPKLIGDIVENWAKFGEGRQTLVFASGVKHSLHLADAFKKVGISSAHVDGDTPADERDQILADFREKRVQVLCNCQIFTEGTDLPEAACLVFARPTKSLLLYLQVAGRVLRTFPGKKDAIILDHSGVLYEHGQIAQDWVWKLDYGEGDVRKETERTVKMPRGITCENCKCSYFSRLDCPECGWKPVMRGKELSTYGEYLQALDEIENPPPVDEKTFYLMLLGYCAEKGKKPGLAFFKFQEKFDKKPMWSWKDLPPIEPNVEVRGWLRKQNAKWHWERKNPALANRSRT